MATILIIDDEESIRFTFRNFLQATGHQVRTAHDYDSAEKEISREPHPDLVFVDIVLGGRPGIDILKFVHGQGLNCPVIVITGEPSVETASEAVRLGAFDYAPKPINKDMLLNLTRVALRHKALEDEKSALEHEKNVLRLRLEAVFRSIPDAVVTVDKSMTIIQANSATERILGLLPEDIMGKPCQQALGPYSSKLCRLAEETLNSRTPVKEFRVECDTGGGERQTMILNSTPLQGEDGSFDGCVLIARDITRLVGLEKQLMEQRRFRNIVGKSQVMRQVYGLLDDLARTDTTVLITGPSGTGKELVAEALHYGGSRADKSLVKVNCSALSESLLESELFGHVRGAFTGAVQDKVGRFALANGGSIFLDEIGDISLGIQLKLLRVLQEKEFERVGDSRTIGVDVRVIAATNQNLREKVRLGEFREDLYYRLKVVEIQMPSLAERREDIPLLISHFTEMFNKQFSRNVQAVSDEARALLMNYPWPGNVRELKHALEHAFILSRDDYLDVEHLPQEVRSDRDAPQTVARGIGLDRERLEKALREAGGNKAKAARLLGISRQTIYRKIDEYGITAG